MKQKLISMTGVLVMLIGITFVTVGCSQANSAGGGSSNGNITNSNNQNNNGNNEIAGVWKITKIGPREFPQPLSGPGVPAGAQQEQYMCLTANGKIIQVAEITGFPGNNGFRKVPQEGSYELLTGNKAKIDLGSGVQTVSYTISGINLKLIEVQIEAVKVTSPTEAEIKALP